MLSVQALCMVLYRAPKEHGYHTLKEEDVHILARRDSIAGKGYGDDSWTHSLSTCCGEDSSTVDARQEQSGLFCECRGQWYMSPWIKGLVSPLYPKT